jgi:hypothetical protein
VTETPANLATSVIEGIFPRGKRFPETVFHIIQSNSILSS